MSNDFTDINYLNKMKINNEKLGINDDFTIEKNKNLIFIYTPPKVGSTKIVSSIRINACGKFTVLHLHNELMLKILYDITDVTILDIIKYNNFLGKNIYVIDIYRSPIEQKISTFFENIQSFHFNVPVEILNTFDIPRIIKRFNQVFPYLQINDHYKTRYNIPYPEIFDFNKKFISIEIDGIKYFKIRLKDSKEWKNILKEILGIEIFIINDYETNKKPINTLFLSFKQEYKIPINLFNNIENNDELRYYYSDEERKIYLDSWIKKTDNIFESFTQEQYIFYTDVALDNQYINEIQMDHYIDLGCLCKGCCRKRGIILLKLMNGEIVNDKIDHNQAACEYIKEKSKHLPMYIKQYKYTRTSIIKNNFIKNTI